MAKDITILQFCINYLHSLNDKDPNSVFINHKFITGLAILYEQEHPDNHIMMSDDDIKWLTDTTNKSFKIVNTDDIYIRLDNNDYMNTLFDNEIAEWHKKYKDVPTNDIYKKIGLNEIYS